MVDVAAIDSTTDNSFNARDFTTLQGALDAVEDAGGGTLFLDTVMRDVPTLLTYNAAAGPLRVAGSGPKSALRATGSSNGIIEVTGVVGSTSNMIEFDHVAFISATSGVSAAGIHLQGVARWYVRSCEFPSGAKMAYAVRGSAAQQGVIADSTLSVERGVLLEPVGAIHSNGIEIHGCTTGCTVATVTLDSVDSSFVHSNHMVVAPIHVDITADGLGKAIIRGNHFESQSTAAVRSAGHVVIDANQCFPVVGGADFVLTGTQQGSVVCNNLIQGDVSFGAGVSRAAFYCNDILSGTFTDLSTDLQSWGNKGGPVSGGSSFTDRMMIKSRATSPGHILTLLPNAAVGGPWGVRVSGSGSTQDAYLQLQDVTLNGNTSTGVLSVKSGISGTEWGRFTGDGVRGFPAIIATGSPPAVGAGEVAIGGVTASTVGSAGGASALPATPAGYIVVNIAGTARKIPYYPT